MANPNPSPATRFKPGQCANPNGRPKGRRFVDILEDLIAEKAATKAIAARWLQAILEGDFRYFQEYINRRDGRPKEDTLGGGDDTEDGKPKGITIPSYDPRYSPPTDGRPAPKRDRKRKPAKRTRNRRAGGHGKDVPDTGGDP